MTEQFGGTAYLQFLLPREMCLEMQCVPLNIFFQNSSKQNNKYTLPLLLTIFFIKKGERLKIKWLPKFKNVYKSLSKLYYLLAKNAIDLWGRCRIPVFAHMWTLGVHSLLQQVIKHQKKIVPFVLLKRIIPGNFVVVRIIFIFNSNNSRSLIM